MTNYTSTKHAAKQMLVSVDTFCYGQAK